MAVSKRPDAKNHTADVLKSTSPKSTSKMEAALHLHKLHFVVRKARCTLRALFSVAEMRGKLDLELSVYLKEGHHALGCIFRHGATTSRVKETGVQSSQSLKMASLISFLLGALRPPVDTPPTELEVWPLLPLPRPVANEGTKQISNAICRKYSMSWPLSSMYSMQVVRTCL